MNIADEFTGEIIDIAFGGSGVMRINGFVIFIPYTVVGEIVRVKIIQKKKSFATGKLIEIIQPSALRQKPICPHFSTCGGCQFQHLHYTTQIQYKKKFIEDALKRIGNINFDLNDFIEAKETLGYRRKIRLTLRGKQNFFEMGFIDEEYSFLKVNECTLFLNNKFNILIEIQKILQKINNPSNQNGTLTLVKDGSERYLLFFEFDQTIPNNLKNLLENSSFCSGVLIKSKKNYLYWGNIETSLQVDNLKINFSSLCFIQNHPKQSEKLYFLTKKILLESLSQIKNPKFLDLFCGIGITSLLASTALKDIPHKIIGIESNPHAIEYAKKNALQNNLPNVDFVCDDVNKRLPRLYSTFQPDVILVNPPRTGLEDSLIQLIRKKATKEIIYISCMPATLARDLKKLICNGYEIVYSCGVDLFPQTSHVETLIHLKNQTCRNLGSK